MTSEQPMNPRFTMTANFSHPCQWRIVEIQLERSETWYPDAAAPIAVAEAPN